MTPTDERATTILGAGWGIGAPNPTCGDGPQALRTGGLAEALRPLLGRVDWGATVRADGGADVVESIGRACAQLAAEVARTVVAGNLPVVLGGDHSCAIATWHGVASTMGATDSLGLLWIDAHLDSHVPETSPSQAVHGMPLACLLGYGSAALTAGARPLRPEHVCVVGAHSFEPAEPALLSRLGVRVFSRDEVRQRGLSTVLAEAYRRVQCGTAGFGVTLDLDAIDPLDAPGVGLPEAGGLGAHELIDALRGVARHPLLRAVEIVEYDPSRDIEQRTERCVRRLLQSMFALASVG